MFGGVLNVFIRPIVGCSSTAQPELNYLYLCNVYTGLTVLKTNHCEFEVAWYNEIQLEGYLIFGISSFEIYWRYIPGH